MIKLYINILILIELIVLTFLINKNFYKGFSIYFILSALSPLLNIYNYTIKFEILGYFIVILVFLLKLYENKNIFCFKLNNVYINLILIQGIYFILFLFISIAYYKNLNCILTFFAILRYYSLFLIFLFSIDKRTILIYTDKYISIVVIVNIIVIIFQLCIPELNHLVFSMWNNNSSLVLFYEVQSKIKRPIGTFTSVINLSTFFVFAFIYFLSKLQKNNNNDFIINCLYIFIIGVILLLLKSKIAIGGLFIAVAFYFIIALFSLNKRSLLIILVLFALIIVYFIIAVYTKNDLIIWYFKSIFDIDKILGSRYYSSGNLFNNYNVIKDNLIFGIGSKEIPNIFIGDSIFISLLTRFGITGLLLYLSTYIYMIFDFIKNKKNYEISFVIIILLVGLGFSFEFLMLYIPFYIIFIFILKKND